jgi:hypothetical protein
MLSTSILLAASMVVGQAEQVKVAVPQEVLSFFGYFVGEWRMEGVALDGAVSGVNTWKWAEAKHCLTYDSLWKDKNGTAHALAICGWDPAKKQLVETEYWTGGGTNTLRYSKISDALWEGTMSGVESDGKELTGKIAYEIKSPTHLVFRATDVKVGGEPRKNVEINYFKK